MDDMRDQARRILLSALMRWCRSRTTRAQLGLPRYPGRRPGVSQADLAEATGYTEHQIGQLERGHLAHPTPDLLTAVAAALRMDEEERAALWALAASMIPPDSGYTTQSDAALTRLCAALDPWPAYVADLTWRVLAANTAVARWFAAPDTLPRGNAAAWLLLDPHARHVYVDWEHHARVLLAQVRAVWSRYPADPAIADLVDYLRSASGQVDRWWVEAGPTVYVLSATEQRVLRAPGYTDPERDDPRHHVPTDLTILAPLRTGDQRRLAVWQLPPGTPATSVVSRDACPACRRLM